MKKLIQTTNRNRWIRWSVGISAYCAWALSGCATPRTETVVHALPPQFFAGVITYHHERIQRLFVSSDRFTSCVDALHETASALAKVADGAEDGWAAKGICIPVPTLQAGDLVPAELQ